MTSTIQYNLPINDMDTYENELNQQMEPINPLDTREIEMDERMDGTGMESASPLPVPSPQPPPPAFDSSVTIGRPIPTTSSPTHKSDSGPKKRSFAEFSGTTEPDSSSHNSHHSHRTTDANSSTHIIDEDDDDSDASLESMVSEMFEDERTSAPPPQRSKPASTSSTADKPIKLSPSISSVTTAHSVTTITSGSESDSILSPPISNWSSSKRAKKSLPPVPIVKDAELDELFNLDDSEQKHQRDEEADDEMERLHSNEEDDGRPPRFKLESKAPLGLFSPPLTATSSTSTSKKTRQQPKSHRPIKRERSASPSHSTASTHSSSSSSILDRLAEHERVARSIPLESDLAAEPFILHDGSITTDQASGLIASIPASINRRLRPYQRDGVKWMFQCWQRAEGGILGDEMGLGKTIQTCGLFAALFSMKKKTAEADSSSTALAASPIAPILLLAPATILTQWHQELREWCPQLNCRIAHGSEKLHALELVEQGKLHILITSYETCLSQLNAINRIKWSLVIMDECHRLRNHEAKTTQTFRQGLDIKIRIGLTGTAIQNNYIELWCLFDVLMPKGTQQTLNQFKNYYWRPIKAGQKYGATLNAIHLKDVRLRELNQWLSRVMLRREKKDVKLELPKKEDNVVFCALTDMQIRCYERALASRDIQSILNGQIDPNAIIFRTFPAHYTEDGCIDGCSPTCPSCLILPMMTFLTKLSNHLGLLQLEHQPDDPKEELYRAIRSGNTIAEQLARDQISKQDKSELLLSKEGAKRERARLFAKLALGPDADAIGGLYRSSTLSAMNSEETCGKMKALKTLLRIWYRTKPRCKVLLFSNSTQMLDILGVFTTRQGYVHRRIDGSTPNKKRSQIVKEFHDNEAIFLLLLSTKAGGVGLNLTCANIVVIFDPNWNPTCLAAGTLVGSPMGGSIPIESIKAGDQLIGEDGHAVTVHSTTTGSSHIMYELSTKDGHHHTVTPEHLVTLHWDVGAWIEVRHRTGAELYGSLTLTYFDRLTLKSESHTWSCLPYGEELPTSTALLYNEVGDELKSEVTQHILVGLNDHELERFALDWLDEQEGSGQLTPLHLGDLFELSANELYDRRAELLQPSSDHWRPPTLPALSLVSSITTSTSSSTIPLSQGRITREILSIERRESVAGTTYVGVELSDKVGRFVLSDGTITHNCDLQSQDRTYRIGQERDVKVYRLISAGCIEEQIYLRQVYKQQLALAALHPEIKQKRYFKGIMKVREHQGELFGVGNLFDFKPKTGFSTSLMKREMELEEGYVIKLDTLRKLRDRMEESGPVTKKEGVPAPASSTAAASAKSESGLAGDGDEDMDATVPFTTDSLEPPPPASLMDSVTIDGCNALPIAPIAMRDEKEVLVDEYALSCVPTFAPLPPETQASQSPATTDDEQDPTDLSVLMRDMDEEDELDRLIEDEDDRKQSSSSAATSSKPPSVPRKTSAVGPSSSAISKLLSSSGMISHQEFQRVMKGSRMEHSISATAQKVFSEMPIPQGRARPMKGEQRDVRNFLSPSSTTASTVTHSSRSKSPSVTPTSSTVSSHSSSAKSSPKLAPPSASSTHSPLPLEAKSITRIRASPPPPTTLALHSPTTSSATSSTVTPSVALHPSEIVLSSKLSAFSAMAHRYGFSNSADFGRYLRDSKMTKEEIAQMIQANQTNEK